MMSSINDHSISYCCYCHPGYAYKQIPLYEHGNSIGLHYDCFKFSLDAISLRDIGLGYGSAERLLTAGRMLIGLWIHFWNSQYFRMTYFMES